jgi:hypothetical protein
MKPIVLILDNVYPDEWLEHKQRESAVLLDSVNYKSYMDWKHGLRSYLHSTISDAFKKHGYDVYEFHSRDPVQLSFLSEKLSIKNLFIRSIYSFLCQICLKDCVRYIRRPGQMLLSFQNIQQEELIRAVFARLRPSIVFLREPTGVPYRIIKDLKKQALFQLVSLIGCQESHTEGWSVESNDLVLSLTQTFANYYAAQGVESKVIQFPVSQEAVRALERIPADDNTRNKVVFVGLLGSNAQKAKTELMESVASNFDEFVWYGPMGHDIDSYPHLKRSNQGIISGLDMLNAYRSAAVVINDFVDSAMGENVNMRSFECLTANAFVVCRKSAKNNIFQERGCFAFFNDNEECISLISEHLSAPHLSGHFRKKSFHLRGELLAINTINDALEGISAVPPHNL